jgi:hypothetical protein
MAQQSHPRCVAQSPFRDAASRDHFRLCAGFSDACLLLRRYWGDKRTSSAPAPVVSGMPSTAICSGLPTLRLRAMLSPWAPSHARAFTLARSGQRQSGRRKHVRMPTGSPVRLETSGCSAFKDRRSRLPRWATRSTPSLAILKSGALAATRIRPLRSTSCGDRRQRPSMNWNGTCAAAGAPKSGAIPTSGAIWWRCAPPRSRRAIRRRTGGRLSGEPVECATAIRSPPTKPRSSRCSASSTATSAICRRRRASFPIVWCAGNLHCGRDRLRGAIPLTSHCRAFATSCTLSYATSGGPLQPIRATSCQASKRKRAQSSPNSIELKPSLLAKPSS